jgi:thioredoxin reductase (NADPH)
MPPDEPPLTASGAPPRLTLITRAECELCEQLLIDLTALRERYPVPAVELLDVDADAALQRRWGLKVPVLLLDGSPVCAQRLDVAELLRVLRL